MDQGQTLNSVIATTEPLQPLERLAFYTGFVRWIFEIMQLIMEAVVTRQLPMEHEDPEEGVMMMQTYSQLQQRVSNGVRDLQSELEKGNTQCQDALRFLRVMMENRYLGIYSWDESHCGAQDLHALLVGHMENTDHVECPPLAAWSSCRESNRPGCGRILVTSAGRPRTPMTRRVKNRSWLRNRNTCRGSGDGS